MVHVLRLKTALAQVADGATSKPIRVAPQGVVLRGAGRV